MNQHIGRRHQLRDVFAETEEAHAGRSCAPSDASGLDRVLRSLGSMPATSSVVSRLGLQRGEHAVEPFDVRLRADPQPDASISAMPSLARTAARCCGGSQIGPLARRIDRRLQHGDALFLRSPAAAIALRRCFGQCQDMRALKRPERFLLQHHLRRGAGAATVRAASGRARGSTDRRSSRSRDPMSLLKPTTRSKPFGGRGRESLGEIQVDPVVGVGADRQQDDRAGRLLETAAILGREERDVVTARDQDAGKPDAIALEPAFRKKLDDSKSYSHRYSTRPVSNCRSRQHVRGLPALASERMPLALRPTRRFTRRRARSCASRLDRVSRNCRPSTPCACRS